MRAVGRTETSTEGTAETDAVNMAEIGTEDTARMGAVGVAGVAAIDTPTFAAIPSPSKVSANKRNGHANKKGRVRGGKKAHTHGLLFFEFRNPPPQDGLIVKILKNVFRLLRRQISVKPTGGRNWDGGRSNYHGGTVLYSLRQSNEGITSGNDKRRDRSSLNLSSSRRDDLANLPNISTLIYVYRPSGRGRSLNRNSMRGCKSGGCWKLNPIKKALHGCAYGDRKLLRSRMIYGKKLGLILEDKKRRGEGDMKIKVTFWRIRKPKAYGKLVNEEMYLQFRLIEHNGTGG